MNYIIYDFETTGREARFDQILQAGFICYDKKLKEINRINLKSRLNPDTIPSLGALRVNKLLLSDLLEEEKSSYLMMRDLNNFLKENTPGIFLGYNSIFFDEEFLRQAFWENFNFPYLTSTGKNLRGDVYNLATMTHAFDKNAFNVDINENGKMIFKLESLSKINNFHINNAHEAIADVEATKKIFEIIRNNSTKLFSNFMENTNLINISKKIKENNFFTIYGYYGFHNIFLATLLGEHPVYNNNYLAYDLRYDPKEIINLDCRSLSDIYYTGKLNGKKFKCFRKLKLNKQPAILDFKYAMSFKPYDKIEIEELQKRKNIIESSEIKKNMNKIQVTEAENYDSFPEYEEQTIYSENLNFQDKSIMENFHKENWEDKWKFASKFKDPRLQFFAAKHLYRNYPEFLPKNIFRRVHEKFSERFNSINEKKFTTLPSAMEEADNLSIEMEENNINDFEKEQLEQYNIYINFLNSYYNDPNPEIIRFDKNLSKKLFY